MSYSLTITETMQVLADTLPWLWALGWIQRLLAITATHLLGAPESKPPRLSHIGEVAALAITWPADMCFESPNENTEFK